MSEYRPDWGDHGYLAEIAADLARLAERAWHHRDLKPANLYYYKGRFVVGDFDLIKRPTDRGNHLDQRSLAFAGLLA